MPNVQHMWCACGYSEPVETTLDADHDAQKIAWTCPSCGRTGTVVDYRLGWADEASWRLRKRQAGGELRGR